MAWLFASIPSALSTTIVHATELASRRNVGTLASARAASIPSVKLLITNRCAPVRLPSRVTREYSAQFRLLMVISHIYEILSYFYIFRKMFSGI